MFIAPPQRRAAAQPLDGQGLFRAERRMNEIIDAPSPNFDDRSLPISMLVLHYTGMVDAASAISRLRDPEAKVSCHYLVSEDGQVLRMVEEKKRAWHAGRSFWRGITDINSASIGIEIVNPGHDFGYRPFPEEQIDALLPLVAGIMERHPISRGNVVGHSDIAPQRKQDPGELFPWNRLAKLRLALPRPTRNLMDPNWTDAGFLLALERFGYDVSDKLAAVVAFQRRFRPELIDGTIDGECRALLLALLLPKPRGDD
jgi:N-acetylmuramoyl-L-alanine amidase